MKRNKSRVKLSSQRTASVQFSDIKWNLVITRNMSLFHQSLSTRGHCIYAKVFGLPPLFNSFITENGLRSHLYVNPEKAALYNKEIGLLIRSRKRIAELEKKYYHYGKKLLAAINKLEKIDAKNWNYFAEMYCLYTASLYLTSAIGRIGFDDLDKLLSKNYPRKRDREEIISRITYPEEHTPLFDSNKELLEIGKKLQSEKGNANRKTLIAAWHKKWRHIPVNFNESAWTLDDANDQLDSILNRECSKEIKNLLNNNTTLIRQKNEILRKQSKVVDNIAYSVAKGTSLNEYRKGVFCKVSLELQSVFRKICKNNNITDWKVCYSLTPKEIGGLIIRKKIDPKKIRKERRLYGFTVNKDGILRTLDKKEVSILYSQIQNKADEKLEIPKDKVHGLSANSGIAKGIAKVILSSQDFRKFNDGDIIVTPMTSVDFVPLMEKAAAFVTNEGGLTSHAAIVSREMGKPCIIGTKFATEVFKDGDYIEVNGDKGIVRKIKSSTKTSTGAYNKDDYTYLGRWVNPPINPWIAWNNSRFMKNLKLPMPGKVVILNHHFFIPKDEVNLIKSYVIKKGFLDKFMKCMHHEILKLQKVVKKLRDHKKHNPEELLTEYLEQWHQVSPPWSCVFFFQDQLEEIIQSQPNAAKILKQVNVARDTPALALQSIQYALKKEIEKQKLPFDLKIIKTKAPKLYKEIIAHVDQYEWYGTHHYVGEPYTKKKFIEAIKSDIQPRRPIKPPENKWAEYTSEIMWLRMLIAETVSQSEYYVIPVLKKVAKNLKIEYDDLLYLTKDEIYSFLKGTKPPSFAARKKAYGSIVVDNKQKVIVGTELQTMLEAWLPKVKKDDKLIGNTANKGIAQGKARIIMEAEEIKDFNEGEILVASETSPVYFPAMEKASAIITEVGGITSHAAIVSRELNKPCIIGVKNITRILKNGDYIEVDADKGIVRKINKSEIKQSTTIKTSVKTKPTIKKQKTERIRPETILWFKDLDKNDIPSVGGKGANLGEMFRNFPIPGGFCVTVNAFRKFLDSTEIGEQIYPLLDNLNHKNPDELDKISKRIRDMILKHPFPANLRKEILKDCKKLNKEVAVRSSATAEDLPTASFAGQHDTFLNIKGNNNIILSVQKCWASLFTSRAIYYRVKNNFNHRDVLISVVIQEMVDADYAGVMFTVDPVNKKYILIEIVEGLGEALVSGQVTPNNYFVHKKDEKIMEKSEHFSFKESLLHKIAEIGRKIESHYKQPMDIELAVKNNKIYILQARPITTL